MEVIEWSKLKFEVYELDDSLPDTPGVYILVVPSLTPGKWIAREVGVAESFAADVLPRSADPFSREFSKKHGRICIRQVDDPVTRRLLQVHLKTIYLSDTDL